MRTLLTTHFLYERSHIRTLVSLLAETSRLPSGEKAKPNIMPVCPVIVVSLPVAISQSRIVESLHPRAKNFSSLEKTMQLTPLWGG